MEGSGFFGHGGFSGFRFSGFWEIIQCVDFGPLGNHAVCGFRVCGRLGQGVVRLQRDLQLHCHRIFLARPSLSRGC